METLVNPTEDSIGLRIMPTLQSLQSWRDVHVKLLHKEKGTLSALEGAASGNQHWVSCIFISGSMGVDAKPENKRKFSDGVLMVVTSRISGRPV